MKFPPINVETYNFSIREDPKIEELKELISNLPGEARIMWNSWRYNEPYKNTDYDICIQNQDLLITDRQANEDPL